MGFDGGERGLWSRRVRWRRAEHADVSFWHAAVAAFNVFRRKVLDAQASVWRAADCGTTSMVIFRRYAILAPSKWMA